MKTLKKIGKALGVLLVALLVAAAITWLSATDTQKEELTDTLAKLTKQSEETICPINWDELPEEVVAWAIVPNTNINQPIVQASADAPNVYLYTDALGQGNYGTPYIDCDTSLDTAFTVIYGHHMSDGAVFADFAKYSSKESAQEHQVIYLYKRGTAEPLELKVIAADVVNANKETIHTVFADDETRRAKLSQQVAASDVVLGTYNPEAQLFAFITCSYQTSNSRTVVYAQVE